MPQTCASAPQQSRAAAGCAHTGDSDSFIGGTGAAHTGAGATCGTVQPLHDFETPIGAAQRRGRARGASAAKKYEVTRGRGGIGAAYESGGKTGSRIMRATRVPTCGSGDGGRARARARKRRAAKATTVKATKATTGGSEFQRRVRMLKQARRAASASKPSRA